MRVHLTLRSENRKVGKIPVSMTEQSSCPNTCAWIKKGCYAKYGPLRLHWDKLSGKNSGSKVKKKHILSWSEFIQKVRQFPIGQLWRHNQAGDLPGKNKRINFRMLAQLVRANKGKKGFTYTHKDPYIPGNRMAIEYANANGLTVNLSADNLEQADRFVALNIAPVCVVVPSEYAELKTSFYTPAGNKIVLCPAARKDLNVSCDSCRLCAFPKRKAIIAFLAHGVAKKTVSQRASLNIVEG